MTRLPAHAAAEIVGDERVDDLRAQSGARGACQTVVFLVGEPRPVILHHDIEAVAAAPGGDGDMPLLASLETMLHTVGDELGEHQ